MVKDRDEKIKKLLEENEKLNSTITGLTRFMSEHLPVKEEA
jgi:pyoverdine/dityrosine biosynthesis protein Dit1